MVFLSGRSSQAAQPLMLHAFKICLFSLCHAPIMSLWVDQVVPWFYGEACKGLIHF